MLNMNEIEAFVDYLPEIKLEVPEIDMNAVFTQAYEISYPIKMRTLDVLHLSACMILNADNFVTIDSEFLERENEIANLGLRIISK